jgi:ABC-type arginine transport system permease subunit
VEICVLIALAIGIAGFVVGSGVMLAAAAGLGSLAGLEVAIREHVAGYRSHTTVLAGMPAILAMAVLFFGGAAQGIVLSAGAALFGTAFWGLRELFKRRSGGFGFK